jgi:hypothetical protein
MEVPKTSGEVEIHGVAFKRTLPAKWRKKIKSSPQLLKVFLD